MLKIFTIFSSMKFVFLVHLILTNLGKNLQLDRQEKDQSFLSSKPLVWAEDKTLYHSSELYFIYGNDKSLLKQGLTELFADNILTVEEDERILNYTFSISADRRFLKIEDLPNYFNFLDGSSLFKIFQDAKIFDRLRSETGELKSMFDFLEFVNQSGVKNGVFLGTEPLPFAQSCALSISALENLQCILQKRSINVGSHISQKKEKIAYELSSMSAYLGEVAKKISGDAHLPPEHIIRFHLTSDYQGRIESTISTLERQLRNLLVILDALKIERDDSELFKQIRNFIGHLLISKSILEFYALIPNYAQKRFFHCNTATHSLANKMSDVVLNLILMMLKDDAGFYRNLSLSLSRENFRWWTANKVRDFIRFAKMATVNKHNIGKVLENSLKMTEDDIKVLLKRRSELIFHEKDDIKNITEEYNSLKAIFKCLLSDHEQERLSFEFNKVEEMLVELKKIKDDKPSEIKDQFDASKKKMQDADKWISKENRKILFVIVGLSVLAGLFMALVYKAFF